MQELHDLLSKNAHAALRDELSKRNVVDIAEFIGSLETEKTPEVFRILPKNISADVFSYMSPEQQEHIISTISDHDISEIMRELFVDDAVDFLEEMPAGLVRKILAATDPNSRSKINEFLQYPPQSGGSLMTTEFVDVTEDTTVSEAISLIRKTALDKETVYNSYVITKDRKLLGRVPLRTLLVSKDTQTVKEIMTSPTLFAYTTDDQESIVQKMRKYDLISIPIVDKEERLCGIVTVDDAIDVLTEESTEDIEKMAALKPSDKPYLKTSVFRLASNRIVWLLVLMISATVSGLVLAGFMKGFNVSERGILLYAVLTLFVPMIIDTGGNAGSQAATLCIRGLALGEIKEKDALKIIWKEIRVALLCGLALAIVNFGRIALLNRGDAVVQGANLVLEIGFIVSISVLAIVVLAKIIGCTLPIFARKLKLDPAIMAAPMITTIVDALGLLIYFGIAMAVLM